MTNYTWDYENRFTRVDLPNGDYSEYIYDPFGKRIKKTVSFSSILNSQYYLYDNEDIIAEYNLDGSLKASYLHGQGIDEPIQVTGHTTQDTNYYSFDGLGSVSELTDGTQTVDESYKYDSFGSTEIYDSSLVLHPSSVVGNPYGFTSREYDSETGLYFYRARYYDSSIGRFISQDPLLKPRYYFFAGKVFYSWNIKSLLKLPSDLVAYTYALNNPVNFFDPMGLFGGCGPNEPGGPADFAGGENWTPYCIKHDCCCACDGISCNQRFCDDLHSSCRSISRKSKTKLAVLRCLKVAQDYCNFASLGCFVNPNDCCECKTRGWWK